MKSTDFNVCGGKWYNVMYYVAFDSVILFTNDPKMFGCHLQDTSGLQFKATNV